MIKILTQNGIENTNLDGARDGYFNSGGKDGISSGILNNGTLTAQGNVLTLDTCEMRIKGHRIVIDEPITKTISGFPTVNTNYQFIAKITYNDGSVTFDTEVRPTTSLIQDDILNGNGTYEVVIGEFIHKTDGTIANLVPMMRVIFGGSGVPAGGTTGQVLKKKSGTDYDTEWGDGGASGTGYILKPTALNDNNLPNVSIDKFQEAIEAYKAGIDVFLDLRGIPSFAHNTKIATAYRYFNSASGESLSFQLTYEYGYTLLARNGAVSVFEGDYAIPTNMESPAFSGKFWGYEDSDSEVHVGWGYPVISGTEAAPFIATKDNDLVTKKYFDDNKTGVGVPAGGTTGQVLKKKSGTDYDTEWGAGGTGGDTIIKDVTPIENSNSWQIAKTDRNALEDAFEKGDTCYVRLCENAYRKYLLRGISYPGKTGGFMMFLGSGYKKTDDNNDWSVIYVATITTSGSSSSEGDYQGVNVFALSENYELLRYIPITRRNLSTAGANAYSGYYIHTGATTEAYECGKIYYKDGDFWAIDGDYNSLNNKTIVNQSLSAEGFTPVANTYYRHTGATTEAYTKGVIYYYNGSEYKRIDGKGTTDYNAFANKPIYNADLSNLSNPTAYTYYRHTGEKTDKFEKGCIYYRDAMGYVKINNAPFALPLQKDANGNLQVQTSKLKQALEAFSQGSIVYLREFFYSSEEDTTPYGAANYMAVRVSGSYASGEINNNRITFVDFIGDGCTEYVINSEPGEYARVIKNTYKFVECPEGNTNEDDVYTVTSIEENTPYLGWRPKHNPVITGGGLAKLYFDKTQTPDLSGFEYTFDESMQMDASSIISNWKMALVAVRFGEAGNYVYGVVYIDANDNPTILYVSSDFEYNGVNLSAGWQTFDNPITLNGVVITSDSISTVSGWNGVWVGREPFYATREYAKSATILASPNGTKYRIKVADDGTLSTEAVTA